MHRSGTSTSSRAVNLLGAYLGENKDMMVAREDNPEGFWERQDIADLDDRILAAHKKDWDCLVPQPEGWHRSSAIAPLRAEVKALLSTHFSGKPLWAWKDPRTTVVFEIWKEAVAELGAALACLVVVRNPLDVARSHQKRDGFSLEKGFGDTLRVDEGTSPDSGTIPGFVLPAGFRLQEVGQRIFYVQDFAHDFSPGILSPAAKKLDPDPSAGAEQVQTSMTPRWIKWCGRQEKRRKMF